MASRTQRKHAGTHTGAASPPPKKTKTDGKEKQRERKQTSSANAQGSKPKAQKRSKNAAAATAAAPSDASGESSDGVEIIEEPQKMRGKRSHKTTVEEVEDEGDAVASDSQGARSRMGSEAEIDEDENEQLARMQKKWNVPIYAFYEEAEIRYKDGRRQHSFKCSKRGCSVHVNRFLDKKDASSTSNLHRHATDCWGPVVMKAAKEVANRNEAREKIVQSLLTSGTITAHFERRKGKITYSHQPHTRAETRLEIAKWVCESVRPFNIVKDPGFLVLMKTGRPNYYIPSPSTVAHDVKTIFARTRKRIARLLQEYDGDLNFTTDCWTSLNHRPFVAVVVHFEWQGAPISIPLDVVEVAKSHTGAELGDAFAEMLADFGIGEKMLGVTCDNASNNDTMVSAMTEDERLPSFDGHRARVRCFLHVLSLIVKTLLKQFDGRPDPEKAVMEEADRVLLNLLEGLQGYDSVIEDDAEGEEDDPDDDEVDAMEDMTEEQRAEFEVQVRPVKVVLAKIRNLAFKVVNSTTRLLPQWRALCVSQKVPNTLLPRDVRTRWNSTFDMLEGALSHKKVVDKMTGDKTNGLRACELSKDEWQTAAQLYKVLEYFKEATLFFSQGTPHLEKVIPAMDKLDKFLTDTSRNGKLQPTIRVASSLAKETLNRYYSYTDMSKAYRIAMVMHPRYKTHYFDQMKWRPDWKKTALELVQNEWHDRYADRPLPGIPDEEEQLPSMPPRTPTDINSDPGVHSDNERNMRGSQSDEQSEKSGSSGLLDSSDEFGLGANIHAIFEDPAPPDLQELGNELERYLRAGVEHCPNAIKWWVDRHAVYPRLSRMALDFLTIPVEAVSFFLTWSQAGFVKAEDERKVVRSDDIEDERKVVRSDDIEGDASDYEMDEGWDKI
ncbi:hypothetical protein GSI_04672 [Ganoderma sinense ZZ0214-1]|uniref:HAT C-terminal dimerisation domain-containing protein n=1 Tax=Ganoderma sinense ZZ0214-1 TaxID=1077348 RepID=A0A2G8SHI0_9APHY|nr:hypothetical protein GSI_04672 [Ganoderma sinense ZZ0214-1]